MALAHLWPPAALSPSLIRMWRIDSTPVAPAAVRWRLEDDAGYALPFAEVIRGWCTCESFRDFWVAGLRALPLDAYCWECPPVDDHRVRHPFECVFVPSPSLDRMTVDRVTFGEHFRPDCESATFSSLGGDAILVAPCPAGPRSDYAHLAQFVRTAPREQQLAFWRAVGQAIEARVGTVPIWLSTSGHGVAWLHVRLDSRPKYYIHSAYART
jgi:hypothetical protein